MTRHLTRQIDDKTENRTYDNKDVSTARRVAREMRRQMLARQMMKG